MGTGAIGIVALCGFTAVRSLCSRAGRAGRKFFCISVRVRVRDRYSFFASRFVVVPSSAPAAIHLSAPAGALLVVSVFGGVTTSSDLRSGEAAPGGAAQVPSDPHEHGV